MASYLAEGWVSRLSTHCEAVCGDCGHAHSEFPACG